MLKQLRIARLAVVDALEVEFAPGLNLLTGETGSGKSVIVDAVQLLLGGRASGDLVRTGESSAFVEGVFECQGNTQLLELLEAGGIDVESDDVIIKREINAQGRGRVFINNQAATAALLRQLQPHLLDIHGQGDQQSLTYPSTHLKLLDSFAGSEELRGSVSDSYESIVKLMNELASRSSLDLQKRLELLRFQVKEIEAADLQPGEEETLEREHLVLANAEKISSLASSAFSALYDDEHSAVAIIAHAIRKFEELAEIDGSVGDQLDQLKNTSYSLEDTSAFLRRYIHSVELSPERLRIVEDRLHEISRLKRKYGGTIENVLSLSLELARELENIETSEDRIQEMLSRLRAASDDYTNLSAKLTFTRRSKAREFEKEVLGGLSDVALERSRFSINFDPVADSSESESLSNLLSQPGLHSLSRTGAERVEFLFSANTGESERRLGEVASGGELSRLMLVLKNVASPSLFPRSLVFDEIDSGIGGRVADAVGRRLKQLARTNQVLCVTHQAQIARYADAHFQVSKRVENERTITGIRELSPAERIEELARMIGGSEITSVARKHARELLKGSVT
jgi:DNA repair protein RecN (Recombination protein N)